MISNARGKHSSPGVYMEEIDKSYATRSLGITTLGVVGETLKGPAFEPIHISDWSEFQDYFGGTSTEKFKGTNYPKYELPYIAKSYLQESKQLEVCRVLGLSGYNAGPAWVLYGQKDNEAKKHIIAILRSKGNYEIADSNDCNTTADRDVLKFDVTGVTITGSSKYESGLDGCNITATTSGTTGLDVAPNNYGLFTIVINGNISVNVSLNPSHKNYIVNVLGMNPLSGDYPLFVEELYDLAHIEACDNKTYNMLGLAKVEGIDNYKEEFRYASTPWFVSELKGDGKNVDVKKLFRFHTISDGNAANTQVKISIANILPDEGLFDVLIRDYNDTDSSEVILERFNKCSMKPGTANYIGLKVGTFDGEYDNKSKYVTVEVVENDMTENCVPCGFLGYPMRKIEGYDMPELSYNTNVNDMIKFNRQYFGMSSLTGVDVDVLNYKGVDAYVNPVLSNGFHLDSSILETGITVTVDGVAGYKFTTVDKNISAKLGYEKAPRILSEDDMEDNPYNEKRLRKFTCYPYGGFDGWDVYRKERTNGNEYRANKYKGAVGNEYTFAPISDAISYGLSGKVINSDYYAYLAGYKQFDNPSKIKINLLATPGIDYVNNQDLVNEVIDIVEEYRQGDCLYIVTTPEYDKDGSFIDALGAVDNLETSEIDSSYVATFYPWVKYFDKANNKYINLPVTKDVMRNFAYTDNISHPWFASAGISRGSVECTKAGHFTKLEEEDVLYEGMINPVKSFGSEGVKIWGNKTIYSKDTPLNRINVRRLMIRIKDLVMKASKELLFEQLDNTLDSQFRSIVEPILANAKQNRGISDYKLVIDNSPEARDRHELPAKIFIKPINCLEYIDISFTIYPESTSFED